ncbi:hypothetical protein E2C01_003910 [Portunus trituberculatus]|uniref:Uncharacterized protein n=1 Tax=Portunus trituberculatus TaxID=210409 RepID=A0A5B7CP78_PORTR|nr:hypothetical protein [Portunus trituberculatus]
MGNEAGVVGVEGEESETREGDECVDRGSSGEGRPRDGWRTGGGGAKGREMRCVWERRWEPFLVLRNMRDVIVLTFTLSEPRGDVVTWWCGGDGVAVFLPPIFRNALFKSTEMITRALKGVSNLRFSHHVTTRRRRGPLARTLPRTRISKQWTLIIVPKPLEPHHLSNAPARHASMLTGTSRRQPEVTWFCKRENCFPRTDE